MEVGSELHDLREQAEGGQADVGSKLHVLRTEVGSQAEVGSVQNVLWAQAEGGHAEVGSLLHVLWGQAKVVRKLCPLTFHFSSSKIL